MVLFLGGGQDNELLCGKVPVFARDRSLGPGLRYQVPGIWRCWYLVLVLVLVLVAVSGTITITRYPGIPVSCTAGKIRDWIIAPCLDNDISHLIASRRYHPNHLL